MGSSSPDQGLRVLLPGGSPTHSLDVEMLESLPKACAIVAATLLTGCIGGDVALEIERAGEFAAIAREASLGGEGACVVVLAPFRDERVDPESFGDVRNAMRMRTGRIVADVSPAEWVRQSLARALVERGLIVHLPDSHEAAARGELVLEGDLELMGTRVRLPYETEIGLRLTLRQDGAIRCSHAFRGISGRNFPRPRSEEDHRAAIERAIDVLLDEFLAHEDLCEHLAPATPR